MRVVEGSAEMPDPALAALVTGAQDQRRCIRIVAHVARSTDAAVDQVATAAAAALNETREVPSDTDLRQLVHAVVSVEVERAVRKSLATAD
ncbi:hypothetical protein BN970_06359 [Mycolicibacterium conceptionense]|uniref:Uncharacterized protein n=1 Tax=Mycolicibacterium conceptionense TaxID=451644 RepID=A0A0U1DX03_9MYCO|nr:hypothetical protein BN970_06359 [Mycolicibacterium conceptionense]